MVMVLMSQRPVIMVQTGFVHSTFSVAQMDPGVFLFSICATEIRIVKIHRMRMVIHFLTLKNIVPVRVFY